MPRMQIIIRSAEKRPHAKTASFTVYVKPGVDMPSIPSKLAEEFKAYLMETSREGECDLVEKKESHA